MGEANRRRTNGEMPRPHKPKPELETFIFFREGMFYPVDIPREHVLANVELNPGTLKVEDLQGNVVWRLQ